MKSSGAILVIGLLAGALAGSLFSQDAKQPQAPISGVGRYQMNDPHLIFDTQTGRHWQHVTRFGASGTHEGWRESPPPWEDNVDAKQVP